MSDLESGVTGELLSIDGDYCFSVLHSHGTPVFVCAWNFAVMPKYIINSS